MPTIHYVHDRLAVCGCTAIGRQEEFLDHGFDAHLQCADVFDPWIATHLDVKCIEFMDGFAIPSSVCKEAIAWLDDHWDRGSKILISCNAGESRSVSITIAFCFRQAILGTAGFVETCDEVCRKVIGAYPHPKVVVSAARYCGQELSFDDLKGFYQRIPVQPPYPWTDELLSHALATLDPRG